MVRLSQRDDDPLDSYINANYLHITTAPNEKIFIAT